MVIHKYKYSCKGAIYFNLGSEMLNENCNFPYYFNNINININLSVHDGGMKLFQQIGPVTNILNVPSIRILLSGSLYVLLNRSILCNCKIEAKIIFFWNHW